MSVVVRAASESDRHYVAKTLARCLQDTTIGRGADWASLSDEVDALVSGWRAEGARLLVAVDEIDPDLVVGFVVGLAPTLHYVYVRAQLRRGGIARALLAELGACSRYTLVPSQRTTLTRRMTYTPRLTIGARRVA